MTTQQPPTPQISWTTTKPYAVIIALGTIIMAGAAFYEAWRHWGLTPASETPAMVPVALGSPTPSASPALTATPALATKHQNICGTWLSSSSHKKYNFVCHGEGFFEIYEVSEGGANKTGTGKITDDGSVEADLISLEKNRKAQLRLRLSTNGQMMDGSWRGEDPRESGRLTFQKV